jgi:hypothetical protein
MDRVMDRNRSLDATLIFNAMRIATEPAQIRRLL